MPAEWGSAGMTIAEHYIVKGYFLFPVFSFL